ncbi:hypothetical protein [Nonomuraea fuscirosea]
MSTLRGQVPAGFPQVSQPQLMRTPDDGIPRSRFRPPVQVSIWS